MKTLCTLGSMAGGFLMKPPPRAAITTMIWLGARSHPVVTCLVALALFHAWRDDRG